MSEPVIRAAEGEGDLAAVRAMIQDYAAAYDFAMCFDGLGDEIATLPGAYGPPQGRLLIATVDSEPAGCVGVRPLSAGVAEAKRLYVRPRFRGRGLGQALCRAMMAAAAAAGYRTLRLDTRWDMMDAKALYRALGFVPIPAYYEGAEDGVEFFEKDLNPGTKIA